MEKNITWKDRQAYDGAKLIGWIVVVTANAVYEMVFCPEGTPHQSQASSESLAKQWIMDQYKNFISA